MGGKDVGMNTGAIYETLTGLFQDVFGDDTLVLRPDLTADEVYGWDSLSHIQMLLAVEQAFNVRFSAAQVSSLSRLGDLADLIQSKRTAMAV
jgi:acyl carrier protein